MRRSFRSRTVGAVLALALVAAACGSGDSASDEPIVVASFGFNESVVVAEIYAQVLEEFGGFGERRDRSSPRVHRDDQLVPRWHTQRRLTLHVGGGPRSVGARGSDLAWLRTGAGQERICGYG